MIETGKILNGDCVEVMKTLPEGCIDLIVTSPPYGVGIAYDVHEDDVEFEIPEPKGVNLPCLKDILLEMEMSKSWEEAQKRYAN